MGWRPRLYLFSALGEFFSLRSACSHGWNLCWGLGARSGDWGGFRIVPVQGSATLPPRLAEPRAGNGMLGQADGEARGAGATGNGWRRLGSGIPGVPHAPVLAKHTPFWRLCWAELRGAKTARRKGGTGGGRGEGREDGARGREAEPRWSALGRPKPSRLQGSETSWVEGGGGSGGGEGPKQPADSALRESFCGLGLLYITQ